MSLVNKVPESFYYYAPLNSEDRKNWLRELLIDNQIYFRNRGQLNDPRELRPILVFEGDKKQLRDYVRKIIDSHWPVKLSPAKRLLEENKLIYRLKNAPQPVEEMLHQTLDKTGIFSVSVTLTNQLLWGHYADGHRGVVVEFDANSGFFLAAQQVKYTNEQPVINRTQNSQDEILEKSFYTKHEDWAYEQEWRVIARWRDQVRIERFLSQHEAPKDFKEFMQNENGPGKYRFPSGAIKSLVLGSNIRLEDTEWLENVIKQAKQPIPIRRAVLGRNGELIIE